MTASRASLPAAVEVEWVDVGRQDPAKEEEDCMRTRDAVSLSFELAEVLDAVEAARVLVWSLQEEAGDYPNRRRAQVQASSAAVLSLAVCRLRLIRAVLASNADPLMLLAPHNAVREDEPADVGDIRLVPWGGAEVRKHAEGELERVGRAAERARGAAR